MVMNSLSQVLSLPIDQQKEVFKNNPILRNLLLKKTADDLQRKASSGDQGNSAPAFQPQVKWVPSAEAGDGMGV